VSQASDETEPGPGTPSEPAGSDNAAGAAAGAGPREAPPPRAGTMAAPRWAWGVLTLVLAMQALDAADRWLMASVLSQDRRMKQELALDETQAGWLVTVLLIGAAVAGPTVGYLADRLRRPRLLAIAFAAWSLAVVATGLARSYVQIEAARAVVGAAGAAAMVIALTMLADAFPRRMRGRAFAAFFLAMPAGAVLGLLLAATLPDIAGWQAAFLVAGAPGLALALLALLVPEPVRGAAEPVDEGRLRLHEHVGPSNEDYIDLMVNSSFNYALFGMAFASFALAGLAYELPAFFAATGIPAGLTHRLLAFLAAKGGPVDPARHVSTLILLAAAVAGTIVGGWLADAFAATRPRRLFLLPGLAMFVAIGCVLAVIYSRSPVVIESSLFLAEGATFLIVPPCFTILAGVTMPNMRGVGFGVALAAGHVLGDLWSPTLMGWVTDTFAQPDSMATGVGQFLQALGAVPIIRPGHDPENLTAGLLVILPALLIAGAVLLAGIRHLPRELALMIAKLRAAPSRRR
jgi:MFS transporter, Spinster family, sphingosine-1-phosphate transporter